MCRSVPQTPQAFTLIYSLKQSMVSIISATKLIELLPTRTSSSRSSGSGISTIPYFSGCSYLQWKIRPVFMGYCPSYIPESLHGIGQVGSHCTSSNPYQFVSKEQRVWKYPVESCGTKGGYVGSPSSTIRSRRAFDPSRSWSSPSSISSTLSKQSDIWRYWNTDVR